MDFPPIEIHPSDGRETASVVSANYLIFGYPCFLFQECRYGSISSVSCHVDEEDGSIPCMGTKVFQKDIKCQYCYQTEETVEHSCMAHYCTQCLSVATPRQRFLSNCTAYTGTFCMGHRSFYKMKVCNFTTGYKWSTAFALSLTLGGFGVDRFYLGFWREGLGKLFSFGGLGVWTMIDVVLIGVGVITPADGSLYI